MGVMPNKLSGVAVVLVWRRRSRDEASELVLFLLPVFCSFL